MPVPSFISSIGGLTSPVPCTPGAELWATPGSGGTLIHWYFAGACPESGTVTCGDAVLPNGYTINYMSPSAGSLCFQDTRMIPAASVGGAASGAASGTPFEYTAEQQQEVYGGLAGVFGALLAAMAVIWGFKQIMQLFNTAGRQGD